MSQHGRRVAWPNREVLLRLQKKKRVYSLWKKSQATQENCKDISRVCRGEMRKAKAQQEFNLDTIVKDNLKCFYKCINTKRRAKENLSPLLDVVRSIITKDKTEILSAFFTSVFKNQDSYPWVTQFHELEDRDRQQK